VDPLPAEVGSTVELEDVLLIAGNGDVRVGQPRLEGARVIAEVVEHGRGPKVIVFKYKAKTRYRRRRGHRQGYTRLAVRQILTAEGPPKAGEKPKRRRVAKAGAKAEAKPAPRARTRKPKPEAETAEAGPALVEVPGAEPKPARRARKPEPEAEAAAPVEAAEAKPSRRPRARKAQAEQAETGTEEKPARGTRARKPAAEGEPARRSRARKPAAEAATEKMKEETPESGE
jgi:large subunit ribosomal protein L21